MEMPKDFIAGFASAVASLGTEGDHRGVDWSEAYKYLEGRLKTFKPIQPPQIAGINILISPDVAPGTIEFRHVDGRTDTFSVR